MRHDRHLVTDAWEDYELLDSGENMKLERFGEAVVARPETQALWAKQKPELWKDANAVFAFGGETKGSWDVRKPLPEPWLIARGDLRLNAKLTNFKHTGIFPEQAPNWAWTRARIAELITTHKNVGRGTSYIGSERPRVLNLFGYTGAATIAAALAGAQVTHVDASKQSLDWARENARASGVREDAIRWIPDDARAFARREARRAQKYEGIILDPPAFGRGAKGQVWKIEEDLPALLAELKRLLTDTPGSFFLLNGYAAGYAPRSFAQTVESVFSSTSFGASGLDGESGELHIQESTSDRVIPAGIYVRFVQK